MLKYIVKRMLQAIPVLLGVSVIVFLIMRVFSADPAPVVLGQHATPEAMQAWRDAQGLNDPIIVQYFDFLFGAIRGDLGESYYTHAPVLQELMARFPATVELALVAIVIAAVAGVALGVLSATHKNTAIDGIATVLALVGVSMPIFWLGISSAILDAAALGFLGLGVQPPAAEWGDMLGRGRNYIFAAPHAMIFPGLAITVTVLAFNLLGDGIRDAFDPKSRNR